MNFKPLWMGLVATLPISGPQVSADPTIESFARSAAEAHLADQPLPQLSFILPEATREQAVDAQFAYVDHILNRDEIAGYKGAVAGADGQEKLGLNGPLSAVLFKSGWLESKDSPVLNIQPDITPAIETELGLILANPITEPVTDIASLKEKVAAIVPVVELPAARLAWSNPITAVDLTANNIGSAHYIVGPRTTDLALNLDQLKIRLYCGKQLINETTGGAARRGQWWNFLYQINEALDRGYELEAGQLVISGALGEIRRDGVGDYRATFSQLGTIRFSLKPPKQTQ